MRIVLVAPPDSPRRVEVEALGGRSEGLQARWMPKRKHSCGSPSCGAVPISFGSSGSPPSFRFSILRWCLRPISLVSYSFRWCYRQYSW